MREEIKEFLEKNSQQSYLTILAPILLDRHVLEAELERLYNLIEEAKEISFRNGYDEGYDDGMECGL